MNTLIYYGFSLLLRVLSWLPLRGARLFGAAVTELAYWLTPRPRRDALLNLETAFPNLPRSSHRKVLHGAYHSLGYVLGEMGAVAYWSKERFLDHTRIEGLEHFERALAQGKGVVVLTGHIGNWEWLTRSVLELNAPMAYIYRNLKPPGLDKLMYGIRAGGGNVPIAREGGLRPILAAFKKGMAVGLIMDQCAPIESGKFVHFLGTPACSHPTPGTLHRLTGVPVVPIFCVREKGGFVLQVQPEQPYPPPNKSEAWLWQATAMDQAAIEEQVRRHPKQWLWMHRRFWVTPDGQESFYRSSK
ncbi:MAG: hypothetical protein COX57_02500 [Alphaproteobacteria bacterium CG_4_10_14_0_2_um_filter_63_37]|nr:MAG: hypothetical protein AUJ55_13280 [Proteobacteria bacterium CG1_02_64_396]PJA25630.1 MAG: hypothetical protein COX57_02500 [Alphaproteobacteria bacterium CG_4_10_14_0_2_um_filter_63_37]